MMSILNTIYSLPFFLGALNGSVLWMLYCRSKVRWQNKYHPLPDGQLHYTNHVSRVWLAGLIAVLGLGYVLLTAQKTHDDTVGLTRDVARCWQESYQATRAQIKLNADNDLISRTQQSLQRKFDVDTSNWLKDLINPPGGLANQSTDSPARQAFGLQRTAEYQGQLDDLGAQFDDQVAQRNLLDVQRSQNKLPEVTCGK